MRRLIALRRGSGEAGRGARRRNQQWGSRKRRALRLATPALALAVLAGAGIWAWESGWLARQGERLLADVHATTAAAGLAVGDVLVEGRARTPAGDVLAALAVTRGSPMLALDPAAARRRLEALPWVREATVERRLPDLVYVRLSERRPLAIWQLQGRLRVIDRTGTIIPGADAGRFATLPLVVGEGAPEHAARLLAVLRAEAELAPRVRAAVRVGARRWNVRLDNGVDIQLPEENAAGAWSRLARLEQRHRVLQRDVRLIDMRLPDRLVVRMAPGAKPFRGTPAPGEST